MPRGPRPQVRLPLPITPRGGAIGTEVALNATGLPPDVTMVVAFANLQSYQLLRLVDTDGEGSFTTTVPVPEWASVNGIHYFFASFEDEVPVAFSEGFHVTAQDGTARVRGTVGATAAGCVDLRNVGDVLYHLVGDVDGMEGERLSVVGTIADSAPCGGTGVVIEVTEAESLSR